VTHGENYINPKFRKELGRSWHWSTAADHLGGCRTSHQQKQLSNGWKVIELVGWVGYVSASYSADTGFKSQHQDGLFRHFQSNILRPVYILKRNKLTQAVVLLNCVREISDWSPGPYSYYYNYRTEFYRGLPRLIETNSETVSK
jgi:hypothetical protein